MGFRVREIEAESNFCRHLTLEALRPVIAPEAIRAVLAEQPFPAQRLRKLSLEATVWLVIAMNLFAQSSLGAVLAKITRGLRLLCLEAEDQLPRDSAITYRRYQLGVRPLVTLFRRLCRPMGLPQTPGAFLFGLRLMALDGSVEDAPDTPENVAYFGRAAGDRGDSAFAKVQAVYLCECGTHAVVDAGFWPISTSERVGGFRLLRSLGPGMLLLWDRGFHDFDMFHAVVARKAHVLSRLSASLKPHFVRALPDGSQLAWLQPSEPKRRQAGERLLVRIITYTFTDPALPGAGQVHRLATTLLDPQQYPALALVCAYHERWEIEVTIDEMQTHQRLAGRPLRSKKPVGVLQELYGLLLAHYAVRFLMHEAALQAGVDPDRISFVHAVEVIRDAVHDFQLAAPELLPRLYRRLLRDLAARPLPPRRPRSNPRVVKRKMSKFHLKRPCHHRWPQPARPFREAVALI
jgi:hypothetical protein